MKILVIGNGGREHTIIYKLKQSPRVETIFASPGNAGILDIAQKAEINNQNDFEEIKNWVKKNNIDITIVGPEAPLADGIVDSFEKDGLKIFGPNRKAAQIEGSKSFSKYIMQKYNIPTADYKEFTSYKEAENYIKQSTFPIVIKADGLAAGKGVLICQTETEAIDALKITMLDKKFGDSGNKIIIEDFMQGEEVSILAFTDSETILPLIPAQDHKNIFEGDKGPNTGGMGAYAPAPVATQAIQKEAYEKILVPIIQGLKQEGITYKGVIYAGLMITKDGPKVVEFNCRFGDPEVQVVLPALENDFVDIIEAILNNDLKSQTLKWSNKSFACVVLASGGYPGTYEKNKLITGLDEISDDIIIFHAGTSKNKEQYFTNGGRVLDIVSYGESLQEALDKIYAAVPKIHFDGVYYRNDIAWKAL